MKLYTRPASFRAQKILVASQYAGVDVVVDTKATEASIKGKSAIAKLPLLETDKGCISESNAIARYIANSRPTAGLQGISLMQQAQVDSWIDFSSNELEVPASVLVYPVIGWMSYHAQASEKAKKDLKATLSVMESHLKTRTFFVGEAITLADIALCCALVLPFKLTLDEKQRKPYPCVTRWFLTCVNQPAFMKVLGSTVLCKKALAVAESAKKQGGSKKESKKEKKAAAAPAPEPAPVKKKAKNPLDELPKSSFVLDSWKKQYSNVAGGDCYKAMPWFWEKYDPEGWSIYHATYNYNDELKVAFMVSNLAGGFIQRCDAVRKYAFGTVQIVGQDGGPMEIVMTWLFRGQSAQPLIEANPDAEHYTWTKVTDLNEAEKKKIADMWCAEDEVLGKKVLDAKVFK